MTIQNNNGVQIASENGVQIFVALAVKSAISLYLKTGMQANRAYTPKNMRAFVTRLTGKTYKASELQKAHDDLAALIETAKAERDAAANTVTA